METADLPLNIASWMLAPAPIPVLLIVLAVLRWTAPQAGPIGMFAAAAIAVLARRTRRALVVVSCGRSNGAAAASGRLRKSVCGNDGGVARTRVPATLPCPLPHCFQR